MVPAVHLVPFGADATQVLVEAVRAAKHTDSLARVTVAVASSYVGITLRRAVASELGGLVAVHVVPLAHVIETLGGPLLAAAGSRPASNALRRGAQRRALSEMGGALAAVAGHHATQDRVARTIADVRGGGPQVATALRDQEDRARDIAAVVAEYGRVLRGFHDNVDLAQAAVAALARGDDSIRALGTVIVHLPPPPDHATFEFLAALVKHAPARVHLGLSGDPEVDSATRTLAHQLGSHAEVPAATRPAFTIVGLPDPAAEVEAALRIVADALDAGTPLHRMAIVYRLSSPYARIAGEAVTRVGWHWSGPSPVTLGDTVAGRSLLSVLGLAEHDLPRDAFAAFLAAAPVVDGPRGVEVPAHRWDVLTREAGIVGGIAQWHDRLAAYTTRLQQQRADCSERDDGSDAQIEHIDANLNEVRRIDAFVTWLVELLATQPEPSWEGYARWVRHLLDSLVPGIGWPDAEARARDDLIRRVDGLGALDALGGLPPSFDDFRRALADELATPLGPTGRVGDGLLVLPVSAAVGLSLDLVVIIGANEGRFPPRGTDDPLLSDPVRAACGLPTRTDRNHREAWQRQAVLAAAPRVTITWAHSDPRAGRALHPARWVVELARVVLEEPVTADDLMIRSFPHVATVPSYAALVTAGPGTPPDIDAFDLATLARHAPAINDHPLFATEGRYHSALAALRARASDRLTTFDGNVGSLDSLGSDTNRELSPTSLEHWATCPRRYLFERILRAGVVERPEGVDDISPLDRGTLVHRILERFVRERPVPLGLDEKWNDNDLGRLELIMQEEFATATSSGLTGRPLLWKLSERRIRGWLTDWLRTDEVTRSRYGTVPDRFELGFGGREPGAEPPVSIALDPTRGLLMRGKIDRVDCSPDGSTVVVHDYKTGNTDRYNAIEPKRTSKKPTAFNPTLSGTALQLPVYALAARQHYPGATKIHTDYWFVGGEESGRQIGYDFDEKHEVEFRRVLNHIATGISSGIFPGDPGNQGFLGFDHCRSCAFDRVCPRDRDVQFTRKGDDPTLASYTALTPVLPLTDPEPGADPVASATTDNHGGATS